jgi:DNA-binding CsgD family transcriptional regulator
VPTPPYLLLPPTADLDGPAEELVRHGWRLHRGLQPPAEPWDLAPARLVAVGPVTDAVAARAALLCAVRGAGLVVGLDPDAPWAADFRADLRRLAPGPEPEPAPAADQPLTADQREILDLLADGHSIAAAARLRYLSLRTANRRVAEAREALGVATTREAVLAYARLRDRA